MRPGAPSGFSNYKRIRKMLVAAVGIEPMSEAPKVKQDVLGRQKAFYSPIREEF